MNPDFQESTNSTNPILLFRSILEMLVIVATLVKHFEFSLPSELEGEKMPQICRKPTVLMMPMAEGYLGPWMGLVVKPLD